MNCKNCGAPMTLNRERDYYQCEYCGTFHFPSASPDGVRTLGENPEGVECPVCHVKFQMVVVDDRYRGYQCGRCRGFLFSRSTFLQLLQSRRAKATTPPESPARYDDRELQRRITCPVCSRMMETYPYLGPGNIVIDTCAPCDLIWLDYRELDKAVNAPGRDRGKPLAEDGEKRVSPEYRKEKKRVRRGKGIDIFSALDQLFGFD